MDRLVLSDAAWERMAPLIIGRPDQKGSTGRNNRMFVEGVHDADHFRKDIAAKKALAVIPNNPSRALKYPLDKHLYAQAVVTLAAIVLWMR
jgi:transposase